MLTGRDLAEFEFETVPADRLTRAHRALILGLFDACYRQANHAYLEHSLGKLRYVSLATRDEKPAGFALGDSRTMDLPRLPRQTVILAGLCCVSPEFRRQGLFGELEGRAFRASDPPVSQRVLTCGRMAHPAAFRSMSRNPTVVPRPGILPTPWQQEIGQLVADAYGVDAFDPRTFVCVGAGKPIGYPMIELAVEPEEWEVFRHVNRDRGDSLLGIAWNPDAPPGWSDLHDKAAWNPTP